MKKYTIPFLSLIIALSSCQSNKSSEEKTIKEVKCFESSQALYDYFVETVNSGDISTASLQLDPNEKEGIKHLQGKSDLKLSFIKETASHGYGKKLLGSRELYYTKFENKDGTSEINLLMIGKIDSNCYKVLTIAPVKTY